MVSCTRDGSDTNLDPDRGDFPGVRIELEQRNERQLLDFYIGGMVSPDGGDPFEAGLAGERGGSFYLNLPEIIARIPELDEPLTKAAEDHVIVWEELEPLIATYYYRYRPIPPTVGDLQQVVGDFRSDDEWFGFLVDGVMSPKTRHIRVPIASLLKAIENYRDNGDRLIYPVGTTFVSEQIEDASPVELSVMTKRGDGYWDFSAYGPSGYLLSVLTREPSNLIVPTRCIGCHFGNRLFEPEKSFPADASSGPDGPRKLHVVDELKNGQMVASIDEHRKRSDTVLGLYATLFITRAQARRRDGTLQPAISSALETAGF